MLLILCKINDIQHVLNSKMPGRRVFPKHIINGPIPKPVISFSKTRI